MNYDAWKTEPDERLTSEEIEELADAGINEKEDEWRDEQ